MRHAAPHHKRPVVRHVLAVEGEGGRRPGQLRHPGRGPQVQRGRLLGQLPQRGLQLLSHVIFIIHLKFVNATVKMQEIDTHINRMKFIVLLYSNWLGILEGISNFKHDEAGCGHNIEAVDPIPQRDEQFRSLAAVAEEVRGPGHALRLAAHHHHRLPEPGELGEVAVLDGGQGQALVSVAQLGVPVARLLALASPPRHTRRPAR